jgi:hypothetical protein
MLFWWLKDHPDYWNVPSGHCTFPGLLSEGTRLESYRFSSCRKRRLFFNLRTAPFKAYSAIWIRRSNFRHQASPRVSSRESTQRRKLELWARNVREFCLNYDFHVTFRDLLHAVKLRHGTDGFTSPPKEGVLRIFSPWKSDGFGRLRTRELWYQRPARYL